MLTLSDEFKTAAALMLLFARWHYHGRREAWFGLCCAKALEHRGTLAGAVWWAMRWEAERPSEDWFSVLTHTVRTLKVEP